MLPVWVCSANLLLQAFPPPVFAGLMKNGKVVGQPNWEKEDGWKRKLNLPYIRKKTMCGRASNSTFLPTILVQVNLADPEFREEACASPLQPLASMKKKGLTI